ncbi:hypothetical protein Aau02nite_29370 [Amorphoplanes auranticolor]|uniref:Uncharacterized protein n=1 Tax=Actinoplanes auranticolor TaxID=47988 RepID=A0A919SAJ3_9ACTN|nr:hypothetical protein Aau02nite_29370 [Actinoplanes auranticolor]
MVDVEGVKLAGAVTIDGLTNAGNEVPQLGLVILRDHRASYSSLRLVRHEYEPTQRRRLAAVLPGGSRGCCADEGWAQGAVARDPGAQ